MVNFYPTHFTLASGAVPGTDHDCCPFDFRDRMQAAARAGITTIGLYYPDIANVLRTYSLHDMRRILDDTGITVVEYEWLNDWCYDGERRLPADAALELILRTADVLGGQHIKASDFMNTTVRLEQASERFSHLCRKVRPSGLNVMFEMLPSGFSNFPSVELSLALVRGAGEVNGGILLDSWHLTRTHTALADLAAALRPGDLIAAELNDGLLADPEDPDDAVRNHRLLVGEGEFDLAGIVSVLARHGFSGPWGIEILSEQLRRCSLDDVACRTVATTRAFFSQFEPPADAAGYPMEIA